MGRVVGVPGGAGGMLGEAEVLGDGDRPGVTVRLPPKQPARGTSKPHTAIIRKVQYSGLNIFRIYSRFQT